MRLMKILLVLTLFIAPMVQAQEQLFGFNEPFLNPVTLEGDKLMSGGQNDRAYELILPEAERGDPAAQTMIGVMYWKGYGRKADFEEAMKWLNAAADQNFKPAMNQLGRIYDDGVLTPRDVKKALEWYGKSGQDQSHFSRYRDLYFHKDSDIFVASNIYDVYDPQTVQTITEKVAFINKLNNILKTHIELPNGLQKGLVFAFHVEFDDNRNVVAIISDGVTACKGCKEGDDERIPHYDEMLKQAYASIENGIRLSSPLPELPSWESKTRTIEIFYPQEVKVENNR